MPKTVRNVYDKYLIYFYVTEPKLRKAYNEVLDIKGICSFR